MQRLVDANDLLMDNSWAFYDENGNRNEACIAVENAPTVDAEPVVRCKDCEFYTEEEHWCRRIGNIGAFDLNDYCSHGERKEDD